MTVRLTRAVAIVCLVAAGTPGCSELDYRAFQAAHDSMRPGMTIREVFEAGLAGYLIRMGIKNVAGSPLSNRRPAGGDCARHVLDISHFEDFPWNFGMFRVRVYCGANAPSATQVIQAASFKDTEGFLRALGTVYVPWTRSMRFRVESPPLQIGGVYDHYEFETDENGEVSKVSLVILSPFRRGK
ncbi:MAG: hypothetical protein HY526_07880 [Betaproteobacteria bacterium]|nr:hypothetical protein [Betaproteobacteria bacterium]